MRSLSGTTLEGRYHVLEMIGEGGMGHVFLAEHVTLKRQVAIKVLREELASQPANVERFFQEAQAASSIHHPNVVDVTDFGRASNGLVYFVMEYLDGSSVSDLIKTGGSVGQERAVHIIRQIALTGCRRGEIINLKWCDVDLDGSCLRLSESKEGRSIRPIGLPVVEFLEARRQTLIPARRKHQD